MFVDLAYAQTGPGPGGLGSFISFAPLILVFVVFYMLLIRPQQKKVKEHQQMLGQLKKNDEVMTSGGIYGKVVAINDKDNTVSVEVAPNVRIRVHRPQISEIVKGDKAVTKEQ
jgi:preprotein translocase subunit YajC